MCCLHFHKTVQCHTSFLMQVTDFGLSVVKGGVTPDSMMQDFCGTPIYMGQFTCFQTTHTEFYIYIYIYIDRYIDREIEIERERERDVLVFCVLPLLGPPSKIQKLS